MYSYSFRLIYADKTQREVIRNSAEEISEIHEKYKTLVKRGVTNIISVTDIVLDTRITRYIPVRFKVFCGEQYLGIVWADSQFHARAEARRLYGINNVVAELA